MLLRNPFSCTLHKYCSLSHLKAYSFRQGERQQKTLHSWNNFLASLKPVAIFTDFNRADYSLLTKFVTIVTNNTDDHGKMKVG